MSKKASFIENLLEVITNVKNAGDITSDYSNRMDTNFIDGATYYDGNNPAYSADAGWYYGVPDNLSSFNFYNPVTDPSEIENLNQQRQYAIEHNNVHDALDIPWSEGIDHSEFDSIGGLPSIIRTILSKYIGEFAVNNYLWQLNDLDPSIGFDDAEFMSRGCPIVIDLDGNGINTLSINMGVYFDHDNNGLAESTGWISSGDAFLVMDRNNDGTINDGNELFGNNTILQNGQKAANGYDALAELDLNSDNLIDINDVAYTQLKVWQDINNDGTSQENELFTLQDAGIQSIQTGYNNVTIDLGDGNTIEQNSSATGINSQVIETADVWFSVDKSKTVNRELDEISEDILALPDAAGFGSLKSLRQSMASDEVLFDLVTAYTQTNDSTLIDEIIYQWAGAASENPFRDSKDDAYYHYLDTRKLKVLEQTVGREFYSEDFFGFPTNAPDMFGGPLVSAEFAKFESYVEAQLLSQTVYKTIFNQAEISYDFATDKLVLDLSGFKTSLKDLALTNPEYVHQVMNIFRTLSNYSSELQQEYATLKTDPILADFGMNVQFSSNDDTIVGDDDADVIYAGIGNDFLYGQGGDDTYYFNIGDGSDRIFDLWGEDSLVFGSGITINSLSVDRGLNSIIINIIDNNGLPTGDIITLDHAIDNYGDADVFSIDYINFSDGSSIDIYDLVAMLPQIPLTENNYLYGTSNNDVINGEAGDDIIYGANGHDTIDGGIGNDHIQGDNGNDVLRGGLGMDKLSGGFGNDLLIGGEGNDYLFGGDGNDIFLFNSGDGADVINQYFADSSNTDILRFGDGISPEISYEDLWFSRNGDDLQINIQGTDDQVTIDDWYYSSSYELDIIEAGSMVLMNNQIDQLVSAMAAYDVPMGSGNVIPQDVKDTLQPILANTWTAN